MYKNNKKGCTKFRTVYKLEGKCFMTQHCAVWFPNVKDECSRTMQHIPQNCR